MTLQLTGAFLQSELRYTCMTLGEKEAFGFERMDIGTKLIQLGAAMGLLVPGKPLNREDNVDGPLVVAGFPCLHLSPGY